jgi:serine protease
VGTQTGGPEAGQWYLRAPTATFRSAADVQGAWAVTRGAPSIVVAVLDTGVLADHEDLDPQRTGRVLPGYDFITDQGTANDGDGRDGDASDPGDWITAREDSRGDFAGCGLSDSTWHGTHVAGIVGAMTGNGVGMAGVAPDARILPVRVLGKCGGWDSDITAGMRWAAGLPLEDVPSNPHPARVLNLSLGGGGDCTVVYRDAVADVIAAGSVVVAAAGNSTGRAVGAPANCPGVIAVTGVRHAGTKVGFSDLGPEIAIAAPGGNCVNVDAGEPCLYPILTTTNTGIRAPVVGGSTYTDAFNYSVGTSFATPIVAGTVALMLSANPSMTASQVKSVLQSTARPFPTDGADNGDDPTPVPVCQAPSNEDQLQCYCVTGLCGAGMLDARAAVAQVADPAFLTSQDPSSNGASTGSGATSAAWLAALALAVGVLRRGRRRVG